MTAPGEAMGIEEGGHHPKIDPADLSAKVDNPTCVLPGMSGKYRETRQG